MAAIYVRILILQISVHKLVTVFTKTKNGSNVLCSQSSLTTVITIKAVLNKGNWDLSMRGSNYSTVWEPANMRLRVFRRKMDRYGTHHAVYRALSSQSRNHKGTLSPSS